MTARIQNSGLARYITAWVALTHWFQWGTGTAAAASATAVTTTTTTEARTSATMSSQTTTVTGDTMRATGTITALGTRSITEVGLFDAVGSGSPPTGGLMDIYVDFASVGVSINDSIAFTIDTKLT